MALMTVRSNTTLMDRGSFATEGLMKTFVLMTTRTHIAELWFRLWGLSWIVLTGLTLLVSGSGCTALHPVRGVPASYLPDQFIGPSRDNKRTIDLSLLVRTPPDQYRVEAGDVLSIYVPRVLGVETTDVNSVGIAPPINMPTSMEDPPTVGFPIQIRDDNTISLPQIPPLNVGKMTLHEVEQAILKAYTVTHKILNPDEAMVMVSLQRPRITRVLVVRQEASTTLSTSTGRGSVNIGTSGKGTARTVTLKAYENDVLHALAHAEGVDGLPGLDAENVIYIIRRRPRQTSEPYIPVTPHMPQTKLTPPSQRHLIRPVSAVNDRTSGSVQNAVYEKIVAMSSSQQHQTYRSRRDGEIIPITHSVQPSSYSDVNGHANSRASSNANGAANNYVYNHGTPWQGHSIQQAPVAPLSPMDRVNALSDSQRLLNGQRPSEIDPIQYLPSPNEQIQYEQAYSQPELISPPQHLPTQQFSTPQYPTQNQAQYPTQYQPQNQVMPYPPAIGGHSMGALPPPAPPAGSEPSLPGQYTGPGQYSGQPEYGNPAPQSALMNELQPTHVPQPEPTPAVNGSGVEQGWASMLQNFNPTIDNPNVIRIPVRLAPGETPHITEDQITLHDGDIIFIESRETEVFYTAGLLGGGQYTLPRDYDLGVLEAVSIAESQNSGGGGGMGRSIGGVSAMNQDVSTSASRLAIIRMLPNGKRITIEVDLKKAMRYQEENIRIQPGDILVLQYTFPEAVSAFTHRYLLEGALFGVAAGVMTQR